MKNYWKIDFYFYFLLYFLVQYMSKYLHCLIRIRYVAKNLQCVKMKTGNNNESLPELLINFRIISKTYNPVKNVSFMLVS